MPDMSGPTWQVVELFAGQGNVSSVFRKYGKAVASFDKDMGGKCMDFTLSAGFLSKSQNRLKHLHDTIPMHRVLYRSINCFLQQVQSLYDSCPEAGIVAGDVCRTGSTISKCIHFLMKSYVHRDMQFRKCGMTTHTTSCYSEPLSFLISSGPGALILCAPPCSSWCRVSRGTTWRTRLNPMGLGYAFVMTGNLVIARLLDYKRFEYVCNRSSQSCDDPPIIYIYIYDSSSTAQGGGRSFRIGNL